MSAPPTFRSAGLLRRLPALGIDALLPALVVALGFGVGAFDARLFYPPSDWFWSEWLFKFWLDEPATLMAPMVAWILLSIAWVGGWEAVGGRSPGARILGLLVIDNSGIKIRQLQALGRALGALINVATLGLGYLWIAVSTYRRGWHDGLSGTRVVRAARDGVGDSTADTL